MARRKPKGTAVWPPVPPPGGQLGTRVPTATLDGVEVPIHPGHARGEDPWGLGSRGRIIIVEDSGTRVPEVREVEGSRDLVTLGPDSPVWETPSMVGSWVDAVRGAIVRLQPPGGSSDATVVSVVDELNEAGAQVVRVMPRRKSSVLPAARAAVAHESAAQVVIQLVAEAHVEDRDALAAFCEGVMVRQGLR